MALAVWPHMSRKFAGDAGHKRYFHLGPDQSWKIIGLKKISKVLILGFRFFIFFVQFYTDHV